MPSSLEQLPIEILTDVAGYLVSYPRDLNRFSLVSSRCRSSCKIHRFRNVRIRALDPPDLLEKVKKIEKILDVYDRYRYVQNVEIEGTMSFFQDDIYFDFRIPHESPYDALDEIDRKAVVNAYQPLLKLISRLKNLREFHFAPKTPIPMTIVRALNEIPTCKLILAHFFIQDAQKGLSADERELVTAPCLYRVTAHISGMDEGDGTNEYSTFSRYLNDALMHLATGISPNLKYITIRFESYFGADFDPILPPAEWQTIPGLPINQSPPSLQGLEVNTHEAALLWLHSLNLSNLRELSFSSHDGFGEADALDVPWLRRGVEFSSLQSLELNLVDAGICGLQNHLETFLKQVSKLRSLKLTLEEVTNSMFDAIIQHQTTLEDLEVRWTRSKTAPDGLDCFIMDLAIRARRLESLKIDIPFGCRIARPRVFAVLAIAPCLRNLNLSYTPKDDPNDASIELRAQIRAVSRGRWHNQDMPHDHTIHTDAKNRYVKFLFGDMIAARRISHEGLTWALSRFELTWDKGITPWSFVIERDWSQLQDSSTELQNIRITERKGTTTIGLWPCQFCPPGQQRMAHLSLDKREQPP